MSGLLHPSKILVDTTYGSDMFDPDQLPPYVVKHGPSA